MKELLLKYKIIYPFIVLSYLFTLGLALKNLYPIKYESTPFFITELLGNPINIPFQLILISGFLNLLLLLLISKKLFSGRVSFIPPIIYAISFWPVFLTAAGSAYIYFLCLWLLFIYAFISAQKIPSKFNLFLLVLSILAIIYSSLISGLTLIFMLISLTLLKPYLVSKTKKPLFVSLVLTLPLVFLSLKNPASLKSSIETNFTLLSDISIINYVNELRGQVSIPIDILISKVTENKYLYTLKFIFLKTLNNLVPSVYFTAQEKMLGFSFTPPILLGFLIPALIGLLKLIKDKINWSYLLIGSILIIPSVISKSSADLNRLILIFPSIIFLITLGFNHLFKNKQKLLLTLIIFFILFQYLVVLFDLELRDKFRIPQVLDSFSFNLGKQ